MDKDLIRIMIFAIGLLVILGMIAWSYLQHEKFRQDLDDYDDEGDIEEDSVLSDDDFELSSLESKSFEKLAIQPTEPSESEPQPSVQVALQAEEEVFKPKKPALVQFSIMAKTEAGFNGVTLFETLSDVGLEYGNLQIFERLDARRLVDFGVASVVKPGIIPSTNLPAFNCPGIVFFMQPSKVDNPLAVFDDFLRTFNTVALQLDVLMLNQHRELLTDEEIIQIRQAILAD